MPLRTPTNLPDDKDIHTRAELWEDVICFEPYFFSDEKQFNPQKSYWKKDRELTYAPIPKRFAEIKKDLKKIFEEQQEIAQRILDERPRLWEIKKQVTDWINTIHPASTGSRETDPILRDLNSLRAVFEAGSLDQQIKTLKEVLAKDHPLPEIDQAKTWCQDLEKQWKKARPNSNICFIKKEMTEGLKFVFQPQGRFFNVLDDYLFWRNGCFYEVSWWERINHENAIVDCVRNKFINDYYNFYSSGFSGITHNSPYLTARHEKCTCPNFPNSNRVVKFLSDWQPTYALWYLYSPLSKETHTTQLCSNGKDMGTIFTYHKLKKLTGKAEQGWIQDTNYFLLPSDYEDKVAVHESPKTTTFFFTDTDKKRLEEWLKDGVKLIIDGKEEVINLWENPHLLEHISVQFWYNGKEIKTCRFVDLKGDNSIFDEPKIKIFSNLSGIHYWMKIGFVLIKWQEQVSFVLEAGKFASWMTKMGSAFASAIPVFGRTLSDATSATLDSMKSFNQNLDSKTVDSKGGFEEREAERRSQLATIDNSEPIISSSPQKSGGGMTLNDTPIKNFAERKNARQYTSWRFAPGKAVSSALGSIPSLLASSVSKNDYSLYEFALKKYDNSVEMLLSFNLDLFECYVNTKRIGKNEGLLLINEKQFINKINKAGFYRFTPHLIEKDDDFFFSDKFTKGIHLYKNNPEEIWDMKLGVASAKSSFSFQTKSMIQTTANEKANSISATDHYAGKDGRSWLTHNSFFGEEGKNTYNFLPELVNVRPISGAPSLNGKICVGCKDFRPSFKEVVECWNYHWPQDEVKCNRDGTGDYMSAYYKDEKIRNNIDEWIADNTEYFRLEEIEKEWDDEYEEIQLPKINSDGSLDWCGHPEKNVFINDGGPTGSSYYPALEEKRRREGKESYARFVPFLSTLEESLGSIKIKEGKHYGSSSRYSNEEIKRRGKKVSKSEYEEKSSSIEYATYAELVQEGKWGYTTKTRKIEVKDDKGTTKPQEETYQDSYKISEAEYNYYVLSKGSWDMHYLSFKWKRLKKKAGSQTETKWIPLGKGSSAKSQYDGLSESKRRRREPRNPYIAEGDKIPSWKFNSSVIWSSVEQGKKILLDKGKSYHAILSAFEVVPGEGKKAKLFTFDKNTDDGQNWEAWLEQSGGTWRIQFSHICLVANVVGNIDGIDGGIEITDFTENIQDVKSEEFGDALNEGLNRVESEQHQEQTLSLEQIQEALHMSQEELAQEYTQEQINQIQAEQIRQTQQTRQSQQTQEEENWEELDNDNRRTRNR